MNVLVIEQETQRQNNLVKSQLTRLDSIVDEQSRLTIVEHWSTLELEVASTLTC